MMDAATSGIHGSRLREFAVFSHKRGQRFSAALARIDVEREEACLFARRNADIRVFPDFLPAPDSRFIGRGVTHAVFRARMCDLKHRMAVNGSIRWQ
jgi:hypothetical protein